MIVGAGEELMMPVMEDEESTVSVSLRQQYRNQSFSPINSCGVSNSEECLFVADEEAVLLWNL